MTKQLSILIPNRNTDCTRLVRTLHHQCEGIGGLLYDITVVDDGSDREMDYAGTSDLKNVTVVRCPKARNRSAMRNRLMGYGLYEWVLTVNSNVEVKDEGLVASFVAAASCRWCVVCGKCKADVDASNLRCRDEYETRPNLFRNTCYMCHRSVGQEVRYDEGIMGYGMEDIVYGAELQDRGYEIRFVEATVHYNAQATSNELYVTLVEESMHTLKGLEQRMQGKVRLLRFIEQHGMMCWMWRGVFPMVQGLMRRNLTGKQPSVRLLPLYKLGYYLTRCE